MADSCDPVNANGPANVDCEGAGEVVKSANQLKKEAKKKEKLEKFKQKKEKLSQTQPKTEVSCIKLGAMGMTVCTRHQSSVHETWERN